MKLSTLLTPLTLAGTVLTATVPPPSTTRPNISPPGFTPTPGPGSTDPLFFRAEVINRQKKTSMLSEISLYGDGFALFYVFAQTWDTLCHPYAVYCAVGDHYGNAYTFQAQADVCPPKEDADSVPDITLLKGPGFNKTVVSNAVFDNWGPLCGGKLTLYCNAQVDEIDSVLLGQKVLGTIGAHNVTSNIIF